MRPVDACLVLAAQGARAWSWSRGSFAQASPCDRADVPVVETVVPLER